MKTGFVAVFLLLAFSVHAGFVRAGQPAGATGKSSKVEQPVLVQPLPSGPSAGGAVSGGLVAKVQAFYERTTDFKASFQQVVKTRSPRRTFTRSGTVWFQRPGKMRWDYLVPDKVHYISDGEVLWSYDVQEGIAYRLPVKDSELYQALGFLTGTARLTDAFNATELPATAAGLVPVLLSSRQPSSSFRSITLFVNPVSGETSETEVVDPIGNVSRVRFDGVSLGKLPTAGFSFTVPAGVRVQDLGSP